MSPGAAETVLLAPLNVSEGRDERRIAALAEAFAPSAGPVTLLDTHSDRDHHRSVLTLAGAPGTLASAIAVGARVAIAEIDVSTHAGVHPRVGALDVAPIVHLDEARRGAACAEALVLADMLGELGIPVLLYGSLAPGRTRATLRRGSNEGLARRLASGELVPDFGPSRTHASAGATLVAARAPLVAFNVELRAPATLEQAQAIAARIREGGSQGLPGVRALGLALDSRDAVQVSTNIEDPAAVSLADVVAAVARSAPVAGAELVGLAPRVALAGFPEKVSLQGGAALEDVLANALTS